MRVDVGDVVAAQPDEADLDFGYGRDLEAHFALGAVLGKGGFGAVRLARCAATGEELACKSVAKALPGCVDARRNARHRENCRREVAVLTALKGTLNVANIHSVFEDDTHIHIVMEYCKGGELHHSAGRRYTEQLVSRYMGCVLRTLAQCHTKGILHRDIKPGNFMLRDSSPDSPLKAIDFGMALFFSESKLPITDAGLDGTPWFMAPEMLQSEIWPASDVWAAGVMAFQLLTGRLPFDDHSCPSSPAVSRVWKSILTDKLDFKRSYWEGVSEEGKDFVRQLLNRDIKARPSAEDALRHVWVAQEAPSASGSRSATAPLHSSVVQRLQRYGQSSLFKQSILELIAKELVPMIQSTRHGPAMFGGRAMSMSSLSSLCGSVHGSASSSLHGGSLRASLAEGSRHGAGGVGTMGPPPPRMVRHSAGSMMSLPTFAERASPAGLRGGSMHGPPTRGLGASTAGGPFGRSPRFLSSQDLAAVATCSCSVCGAPCSYAPTVAGLSQHGLRHFRRPAALDVHELAPSVPVDRLESKSLHGKPVGISPFDAVTAPRAPQSALSRGNNAGASVPFTPLAPILSTSLGSGLSLLESSRPPAPCGGWQQSQQPPVSPPATGQMGRKSVLFESRGGSLDLPDSARAGSSNHASNWPTRRQVVLPARSRSVHGGAAYSRSVSTNIQQPAAGWPRGSAAGADRHAVIGETKSFHRAMQRINSMVFERQLNSVAESEGRGDDERHVRFDASLSMARAGVDRLAIAPPVRLAWDDSLVMEPPGCEPGSRRSMDMVRRPGDLVAAKRRRTDEVSRVVCERCCAASESGRSNASRRTSMSGSGADALAQPPSGKTLTRSYSDPELPVLKVSDAEVLRKLMEKLDFQGESMEMGALADHLISMGFQVTRNEAIHLLQQMGLGVDNNLVTRAQFMASQMDWQVLQARYKDMWIEQASKVFGELDTDSSGTVSGAEIAHMLRRKLQDEDVEEAVHHAFWEAGLLEDMTQSCDGMEIPFDTFLGTLARWDDLGHFEARSMCPVAEELQLAEPGEAMEVDEEERAVRGGNMALAMMLGDCGAEPADAMEEAPPSEAPEPHVAAPSEEAPCRPAAQEQPYVSPYRRDL